MNEELKELQILWNKEFDGSASGLESARLAALMQNGALMDAFTELQAGQSAAEPEAALTESQWAALDAKVQRGWMRFKSPLWSRPLVWALTAGCSLGLAAIIGSWQSAPTARPYEEEILVTHPYQAPARQEAPAEELQEAAAEAPQPVLAPHMQAPRAVPSREVKASTISFNVDQPKSGPFRILVKDSGGRVVRSLFSGSKDKGSWHFGWNGLNDQSRKVLPGSYKVEILTAAGETSREIEIRAKK